MIKPRIIALYLPQFHPIPENDVWWGKGFTEWTNVAKAKPLFIDHYQPRIPADLGFYDLRMPEVREAQAKMAQEAGIEGFCYYHYWFGDGKQLLERPFKEVLQTGAPDFPFCLCWANHTWTSKTWQKSSIMTKDSVLIEQKYLGEQDYVSHFYAVLDAFKDKRYICVDGKPMFVIYDVLQFTDISNFIKIWRGLAIQNGLAGIHFVGIAHSVSTTTIGEQKRWKTPDLNESSKIFNYVLNLGFDAVNSFGKRRAEVFHQGKFFFTLKLALSKLGVHSLNKIDYKDVIKHFFVPEDSWENVYPTIYPQYDRSPRSGKVENIYVNSTPSRFKKHVEAAIDLIKNKEPEHQILFLKSWNEWGEGNYIEPDLKYGKGYLDALSSVINREQYSR